MALTAEKTTIVGSLAPASNREAAEAATRVPGGIDMVEIRLDRFQEAPDLPALRRAFGAAPALATLRSSREGGGFTGGTEERERLLASAVEAGFDLVDVELRSAGDLLRRLDPARVVLSVHETSGLPADLPGLLGAMKETKAAHLKIVATARDSRDALALLRVQRGGTDFRLSCFAMGEAGIATRVLAPYLGAALSFGALSAGGATAPGQLLAADLAEVYAIGRARPVEDVYALFGGLVSHSFSPALHNANFEGHGQPSLYVPFALGSLKDEFRALVEGLSELGLPLRGASVTVPFKEQAAAAAEEGERGAANTLIRSADGFVASNTDRTAIASLLPPLPPAAGEGRALVLGAGGTARAALEALRSRGWETFVASRTASRAEALAGETGASVLASPGARERFDVVVNATPLGMAEGDPLPCPASLFRPGMTLIDAPYRPGGTALCRAARESGARVVDGFTLLVEQAAFQAELFTSRKTSGDELRSRLPERIRRTFEVTA